MLQKIRERSQGLVAGVIVTFIAVLMALFGLQYYLGDNQGDAYVAKVNGTSISTKQFDHLYALQRSAQTDPRVLAMLQQPQFVAMFKEAMLQRMIGKLLYQQTIDRLPLAVTDEMVQQSVLAHPSFLRNGQFSKALYERYLAASLISSEDFLRERVLAIKEVQLGSGLRDTALVLPNDLRDAIDVYYQQRDVGYFMLRAQDFVASQHIDDKAIREDYQAHRAAFATPERVQLSYIVVSAEALKQNIQVTPEDIRQDYEDNKVDYTHVDAQQVSQVLPLAAVRARIVAKLLNQRVAELYSEVSERLADLAYTRPNSLATASEALHVPVHTTGWLSLVRDAPDADHVLDAAAPTASLEGSLPAVMQPYRTAIFKAVMSPEVLHEGNNSAVIALGEGQAMVLRIKAHEPSKEQPFNARIGKQIRARLQAEHAHVAMEKRMQWLKAQLQSGVKAEVLARQYHMAWHRENQVTMQTQLDVAFDDVALKRAVFSLHGDPAKSPMVATVPLGQGQAMVVQVLAMHPAKVTPQEAAAMRRNLRVMHGEMSMALFLLPGFEKAKIEVPAHNRHPEPV